MSVGDVAGLNLSTGKLYRVSMAANARTRRLYSSLKDTIKRRFGCAMKISESAGCYYFAKGVVAGLSTERRTAEGERVRRATKCGRAGKTSADNIEIVFDRIPRHWLDDHAASAVGEDLRDPFHSALRISHVVQAIEKAHHIKLLIRNIGGARDLKRNSVGNASVICSFASFGDGGFVVVVTVEC